LVCHWLQDLFSNRRLIVGSVLCQNRSWSLTWLFHSPGDSVVFADQAAHDALCSIDAMRTALGPFIRAEPADDLEERAAASGPDPRPGGTSS
jgi:hypothetical protein